MLWTVFLVMAYFALNALWLLLGAVLQVVMARLVTVKNPLFDLAGYLATASVLVQIVVNVVLVARLAIRAILAVF